MEIAIQGRTFSRVAIVDDDPQNRETLAEAVTDADLEPFLVENPLRSLDELVRIVEREAQAAVLDHRLSPGNLADFTGAEGVAKLYERQIPALLVTGYSLQAELRSIVKYRSRIPVFLSHLEADVVKESIAKCIREFNSDYDPARRPTQTVLQVAEIDRDTTPPLVYLVISSWDPNEWVAVPDVLFPQELRDGVSVGRRYVALVNTAAAQVEDLYLTTIREIGDLEPRYADLVRS